MLRVHPFLPLSGSVAAFLLILPDESSSAVVSGDG